MLYQHTYKSMYGNSATSSLSVEDANLRVLNMDSNNCTNCTNCNNCSYCTNCTNCTNCSDCFNCTDCSDCLNCTDCKAVQHFQNTKSEKIIQLLNLTWPISFNTSHMAIGCQYHSIQRWKAFTDDEIQAMETRALQFWKKYKSFIFQTIEAFK